jgi:hypothetical protein
LPTELGFVSCGEFVKQFGIAGEALPSTILGIESSIIACGQRPFRVRAFNIALLRLDRH